MVLYFVCEQHLLAAYTFAVAASKLLRYEKFIILMINIFLMVGFRAIKCIIFEKKDIPMESKNVVTFDL
jgi:hypothetical protein